MLKNQRSERHQPLFRLDRPDRCSGFVSRNKRSSPNQKTCQTNSATPELLQLNYEKCELTVSPRFRLPQMPH